MRTIENREGVTADLTVQDQLLVRSKVIGHIVVPRGTSLDVRGYVIGGVTVKAGGTAIISGTCQGGLMNKGNADIYGTLIGGIRGRGRTRVSAGALIDGVRGSQLNWERTPFANEEMWAGQERQFNVGDGKISVVGVRTIEDHLVVQGQLELYDYAANGVHVPADAWLRLVGAVGGGMTVDPGGHAIIQGTCLGDIVNNGEVDVLGVVSGKITGSGRTRISPDAIVDGVKGSDLRGA
ncbi:MAG: hypothetical protein WAM97_22005 [Acidimicrobiales bacterium]